MTKRANKNITLTMKYLEDSIFLIWTCYSITSGCLYILK